MLELGMTLKGSSNIIPIQIKMFLSWYIREFLGRCCGRVMSVNCAEVFGSNCTLKTVCSWSKYIMGEFLLLRVILTFWRSSRFMLYAVKLFTVLCKLTMIGCRCHFLLWMIFMNELVLYAMLTLSVQEIHETHSSNM